MALYKLPEWLEAFDMGTLGLTAFTASQFNDDRIARTLDSVYKSNRKQMFFRIALRSIKIFELSYKHIHHDTTSVKLYGAYQNWHNDPVATQGHSKDYRPDLKQLVLGLNVSGDGAVPLLHKVFSGNRTDDSIHISNWDLLRRLLQTNEFIYTADSKLCTEKNLHHIEFYEGLYITVMPRTWKEDETFRNKLMDGKTIKWRLILQRPNSRYPDSVIDKYYTTKIEYLNDGKRRLIWIKSSQKEQDDRQKREMAISTTIDCLEHLNTKINRYTLKRMKEIKGAVKSVLKEYKTEDFILYSIRKRIIAQKRFTKKGRPGKNTPFKNVRHTEYYISFEINKDEIQRQSRTDGIFPLLTNTITTTAKEVLETYKFQSFLENRHSQVKSVLRIAPVFLKKPHRVLSLVDIVILSLTVATLMERDLRLGMVKNNVDSIPIYPEQRECKYPTTQSIIRAFSDVERYELADEGNTIKDYFPATLNKLQKQILNLMEVPEQIYS
jgi:transposase